MKKFYSCLIILTFLSSCTDIETAPHQEPATMAHKTPGTNLPAYARNPYDNAGWIYDELFDEYYNGSDRRETVEGVINTVTTIANDNSSFATINADGYRPLSAQRVEYLASRRNPDIGGIITASALSPTAKTSFGNFLITIMTLNSVETDAVSVYDDIVQYEDKVITNVFLTGNDKRIILTTTSILRHCAYRAKKKPKKNTDPDWLVLVTHVLGAEEGAEENIPKAIMLSLVTGIVSNK